MPRMAWGCRSLASERLNPTACVMVPPACRKPTLFCVGVAGGCRPRKSTHPKGVWQTVWTTGCLQAFHACCGSCGKKVSSMSDADESTRTVSVSDGCTNWPMGSSSSTKRRSRPRADDHTTSLLARTSTASPPPHATGSTATASTTTAHPLAKNPRIKRSITSLLHLQNRLPAQLYHPRMPGIQRSDA